MNRHIKMIFLIILCATSVEAQYNKIDSLTALLKEQNADSLTVEIYRSLAAAYTFLSLDTSLYYNQLTYDLAKKNKLFDRQVRAQINTGFIYNRQGKRDKGKECIKQSLDFSKSIQDTALMALSMCCLGDIERDLGEFEEAIKYYQTAFDWALLSHNNRNLQIINNSLGVVNLELGRFEEAIPYFKQAAAISKRNNTPVASALYKMNLGAAYAELGKSELAIAELKEVIEFLPVEEDAPTIALCYSNTADALNDLGRYQEALEATQKAYSISVKYDCKDVFIEVFYEKSVALLGLKKYTPAIQAAQEGIEWIEKRGPITRKPRLYKVLAEAHFYTQNTNEAIIWERKYSMLQDSLHRIDKNQEIERLEISFQSKQKDAENALLREEKKNQYLVIKQRTRIAIVTALVLLLSSIILFQLYLAKNKSKQMNKELGEQVRIRTSELEDSNKQLVQSNQELERFAYIASHDLKEPLRTMGSFISLIENKIRNKSYDGLEDHIFFVKKNNKQMYQLVEAILEYSKMNFKQNPSMEITDLNKEVTNLCSTLKLIDWKSGQVIFKDLPTIQFYPIVLKIVLKNLIENAIKFNESKKPTVHISTNTTDDNFNIIVTDNGIGISAEYHHKIFDMFIRLHNRQDYEGAGMGLAFCKKVLSNNGGEISVQSKENEGSTFTIKLPLKVLQLPVKENSSLMPEHNVI